MSQERGRVCIKAQGHRWPTESREPGKAESCDKGDRTPVLDLELQLDESEQRACKRPKTVEEKSLN